MPTLRYEKERGSEIGYRTDTKELYIGSSDGNVRLCGASDIPEINAKIDEIFTRLAALTPSE